MKKLKRISKGWLILYSVICPAIILIIYLIFWIIFDLNVNNFNIIFIEYFNNSYQEMCYFDNTFIYITLSMITAPLFCLCLLSYEARKLPKDFNETFWIGASLYSVAIMVIVSVPIMVNENIEHLLKMELVFVSGIICINMILIFLFWVKIYRLIVGDKNDLGKLEAYVTNSNISMANIRPAALSTASSNSSGSNTNIPTTVDVLQVQHKS
eukprot:152899_1